MRIVTSNIRFSNPADGDNSWTNRKTILFELLNSLDADFIGTQEGREPQLRELENNLHEMELSCKHRPWIEERMYPCLFIKSQINIHKAGDLWLSHSPEVPGTKINNSAFPRLSTWVIAESDSKPFLIVNLHLDHTTDEVRVEQAQIIIKEIKRINSKKLPLIIMGDFNASPMSEVYFLIINELNLIDPWKTFSKEEETSYHRFEGTFEKGERIDWILHSSEFRVISIKLLKDSKNGFFPSDHFPLSCDIILK